MGEGPPLWAGQRWVGSEKPALPPRWLTLRAGDQDWSPQGPGRHLCGSSKPHACGPFNSTAAPQLLSSASVPRPALGCCPEGRPGSAGQGQLPAKRLASPSQETLVNSQGTPRPPPSLSASRAPTPLRGWRRTQPEPRISLVFRPVQPQVAQLPPQELDLGPPARVPLRSPLLQQLPTGCTPHPEASGLLLTTPRAPRGGTGAPAVAGGTGWLRGQRIVCERLVSAQPAELAPGERAPVVLRPSALASTWAQPTGDAPAGRRSYPASSSSRLGRLMPRALRAASCAWICGSLSAAHTTSVLQLQNQRTALSMARPPCSCCRFRRLLPPVPPGPNRRPALALLRSGPPRALSPAPCSEPRPVF